MVEVIPPDREAVGDPALVEWTELSGHLPRVQAALRAHATQVTVDGADVVHVGGQREPGRIVQWHAGGREDDAGRVGAGV